LANLFRTVGGGPCRTSKKSETVITEAHGPCGRGSRTTRLEALRRAVPFLQRAPDGAADLRERPSTVRRACSFSRMVGAVPQERRLSVRPQEALDSGAAARALRTVSSRGPGSVRDPSGATAIGPSLPAARRMVGIRAIDCWEIARLSQTRRGAGEYPTARRFGFAPQQPSAGRRRLGGTPLFEVHGAGGGGGSRGAAQPRLCPQQSWSADTSPELRANGF
jgi:hypothetical protein